MAICSVNGKYYIGQTRKYYNTRKIGIKGRWQHHVFDAKASREKCIYLERAIRKHGTEKFELKKLMTCSLEELNYFEKLYIELCNCIFPNRSYNCTIGGDNFQYSEERQKEINKANSERSKIRWQQEGFKEHISQKNSEINKTRMWDPDVRKNLLAGTQKLKKSGLPTNICEFRRGKDKVLIGYYVRIQINKKITSQNFISGEISLEQNLENAKQHLQQILNNLRK